MLQFLNRSEIHFVVACLVLVPWHSGVADEEMTREKVEVVAKSYLTNRDSFDNILCRYSLRRFMPGTQLRALQGHGDTVGTAEGLLLRDGEKIRCENNLDRHALAEARLTGELFFIPRRVLYDGNQGITYSPLLQGGVLYSDRYPPEGLPYTPFDLGGFVTMSEHEHPGFIVLSDRAKNKDVDFKFSIEENASLEEPYASFAASKNELLFLKYEFRLHQLVVELAFYIDPALGYLPVYSEKSVNQVVLSRALITKASDLGEGRVFPLRSFYYTLRNNPNENDVVSYAVETNTTELNLNPKTDETQFRLSISESKDYSVFRDPAIDGSQFCHHDYEPISYSDLPALYQRAAEQAKKETAWEMLRKMRRDAR